MNKMPKFPNQGQPILPYSRALHSHIQSRTEFNQYQRGDNLLPDYGFVVTKFDANTMYVYQVDGTNDWMRRGIACPLVVDGGEVFKSLAGLNANNETYYIYLELENSNGDKDPALIPDRCAAVAADAATWGGLTLDFRNKIRLIAIVTTDGNGDIDDYSVVRRGGIIGDTAVVPDASSWSADDPVLQTIRFYGVDDEHEGELGLYGSEGSWAGEYKIPYLPKDGSDTGSLTWAVFDADLGGNEQGTQLSIQFKSSVWQLWDFDDATSAGTLHEVDDLVLIRDATGPELKYVDAADFAQWGGDEIIKYINVEQTVEHWNLEFNPGVGSIAGQNPDHDARYWILGEGNRNWGTAIGNAAAPANTVINLTGSELTDGATSHLDWLNRELEGGVWKVTDGTAYSGAGTAAFQITGGYEFGARSFGTAGGFEIDLLSGTEAGLFTGDNSHFCSMGRTDEALHMENGTDIIDVLDDNSSYLFVVTSGAGMITGIDDGTYGLETTGKIKSDAGYNINGNDGATLADGGNNLFELGLFVNDAPAYSIFGARLVPSGGGPPVNMNVIARAI